MSNDFGLGNVVLDMMDTEVEPEDYKGGGRAAVLWQMPYTERSLFSARQDFVWA